MRESSLISMQGVAVLAQPGDSPSHMLPGDRCGMEADPDSNFPRTLSKDKVPALGPGGILNSPAASSESAVSATCRGGDCAATGVVRFAAQLCIIGL